MSGFLYLNGFFYEAVISCSEVQWLQGDNNRLSHQVDYKQESAKIASVNLNK